MIELKELIPKFAEDNNLNEKDAHDMIIGWLERTKVSMNRLEYLMIEVPGLGCFTMKHWKIDKKLEELQRKRKYTKPEFQFWYDKGIEAFKRARVLKDEEDKKKEEHKKIKQEYKWNKEREQKLKENELEGKTTSGLEE